MSSNKRALKKLSLMLILTFIIQIIILLKASRTASIFGVSQDMDVYNFINSIATFLFSFLGAGVTTVLIPAFSQKRKDPNAINSFITLLYGFAFIVLILLVIQRSFIFTLFTNYSGEYFTLACKLMFVILFTQYTNCINNVFISYLQCRDKFNFPKFISIFTTGSLTLIVFYLKNLSIYAYSVITMISILVETILLGVYSYYNGFRFSFKLEVKNREFNSIVKMFIPTLWGSGVYQLTLITDSLISSGIGAGNLSMLTYANTISGMLNTIICVNVVSYIYPKISSESDDKLGKEKLFKYLIFFAFLMCMLVVAFLSGGKESISILFERGMFTQSATNSVFICVLIYLLGFPFNIMRDVIYRYFYSKGNTKSTFYNGFFASILNIFISIIFSKSIGLYGIVLGTTFTSVFSFTSILMRFKKEYGFTDSSYVFLKELFKLLFSTIVGCICCLFLKKIVIFKYVLIEASLIALVSLIAFIVSLFVLKSNFYKVDF